MDILGKAKCMDTKSVDFGRIVVAGTTLSRTSRLSFYSGRNLGTHFSQQHKAAYVPC
jgi:hypothetical protein